MLPLLLAVVLSGSAPGATDPAAACRTALERGVAKLEKLAPPKRLAASLDLLATACPKQLGALAKTASKAKALRRAERAKALAAALEGAAPCATDAPAAAAGALLRECPTEKLVLAPEVGRDLDAGTYLFVVDVERRLNKFGAYGEAAERVLSILVLGAALEGEAAR